MAEKTEMISFDETMKKLLQQYGTEVTATLNRCIEKTGKETKKRLRNDTTFNDTGEYAKGWNTITEKRRLQPTKVIVANTGKHGGLAHLLEHGHPIRNGQNGNMTYGGWDGKEHIAPIEEEMQQYFIDEVEQALGE